MIRLSAFDSPYMALEACYKLRPRCAVHADKALMGTLPADEAWRRAGRPRKVKNLSKKEALALLDRARSAEAGEWEVAGGHERRGLRGPGDRSRLLGYWDAPETPWDLLLVSDTSAPRIRKKLKKDLKKAGAEPNPCGGYQRNPPEPIDARQRELLQKRWSSVSDPGMHKLREELLAIGGDEVVPVSEPDLQLLLSRGREIEGPVKVMRGDTSRCHQNVAHLVANDPDMRPATGWVLDDDLWRQHSWGVLEDGTIIETTQKRDKYWGVILEGEEASEFLTVETSSEWDKVKEFDKVWFVAGDPNPYDTREEAIEGAESFANASLEYLKNADPDYAPPDWEDFVAGIFWHEDPNGEDAVLIWPDTAGEADDLREKYGFARAIPRRRGGRVERWWRKLRGDDEEENPPWIYEDYEEENPPAVLTRHDVASLHELWDTREADYDGEVSMTSVGYVDVHSDGDVTAHGQLIGNLEQDQWTHQPTGGPSKAKSFARSLRARR